MNISINIRIFERSDYRNLLVLEKTLKAGFGIYKRIYAKAFAFKDKALVENKNLYLHNVSFINLNALSSMYPLLYINIANFKAL